MRVVAPRLAESAKPPTLLLWSRTLLPPPGPVSYMWRHSHDLVSPLARNKGLSSRREEVGRGVEERGTCELKKNKK
jgi:hypothetical protein